MYEQDSLSALDAITEAQRIAFAPMLFQTALCLRNAGVLTWLDKQGKRGATLDEITENSTINEYAASFASILAPCIPKLPKGLNPKRIMILARINLLQSL